MFHPHSKYVWPELLSKLFIVPLTVLLLLLFIAQLAMLQRIEPVQPTPHPYYIAKVQ